jgi:glycosyltransferase involved in cell wall biosynthesis
MKIRVLYDLGLVSSLHRDQNSLTGIFRVALNVPINLLHLDNLKLTFCTTNLVDDVEGYVRKHPRLKEASVAFSRSQRFLAPMDKALDGMLSFQTARKIRGLGHIRHYLHVAKLILNQKCFPIIPVENLSDFHLYHSPFLPIPGKILENGKIHKFLTVYDLIPIKFPQWFAGSETKILSQVIENVRKGAWAVCISESTKKDLCELSGCDPQRVFVTPLAASNLFYPCDDLDKKKSVLENYKIPNAPYILSLCTLEPRKNVERIIRAFSQYVVQEKNQDLNLVLVGNKGWKYHAVFQEMERLAHLRNRIHFTGFVDDADLAALYSGALAFFYMSYYEGFGLPPLEAMQCGIPVVTSNTSSLPEVVGSAGIMLSPEDEEGMANAMMKLFHDSDLQARMKKQSLEQAALFSWTKCAESTARAYEHAVKSA